MHIRLKDAPRPLRPYATQHSATGGFLTDPPPNTRHAQGSTSDSARGNSNQSVQINVWSAAHVWGQHIGTTVAPSSGVEKGEINY